MPANWVGDNPKKEKAWNRAKKIVKDQYGATEDNWEIVMHIAENIYKHSNIVRRVLVGYIKNKVVESYLIKLN